METLGTVAVIALPIVIVASWLFVRRRPRNGKVPRLFVPPQDHRGLRG